MDVKTYNGEVKAFLENFLNLAASKREEYTIGRGDTDVHTNFKSIGQRMKLDPKIVLWNYALKHVDSITNFVISDKTFSDEKIDGRLGDLIMYCLLLHTLILDQAQQRNEETPPPNVIPGKPDPVREIARLRRKKIDELMNTKADIKEGSGRGQGGV